MDTAPTLPPPHALGAPHQYQQWRPGQAGAVLHVIDSKARVDGLVLPTGAGKSLVAALVAQMSGWRTAILTSTRGLQDQILRSFQDLGLEDLRGRRHYPCQLLAKGATADLGPCRVGGQCPWRDAGCAYFDAVRHAKSTKLLVTNYAAWMAQYGFNEGLGPFDCLVCDEAHAAPEEVASYLARSVTARQLDTLDLAPPTAPTEMGAWVRWAKRHAPAVQEALQALTAQVRAEGMGAPLRHARAFQDAAHTVTRLASAVPEEWLVTQVGQDEYQFHPLEIAPLVEGALFRGIKKIVLTSATLTPKTAQALGLTEVAWYTAPSTFPVERRPVIHIVTCRIDHRLDHAGTLQWLRRVDQILRNRGDRKGIIHTGSYARAKLILDHSEYASRLLLHDRHSLRDQVLKFRAAPPGAVLISPSLTTGFDFAGRACEYQVLVKVPWPDSREPIVAARTVRDRDYPAYVAMQDLVQAVGRGMRSEDDQCETFILDDHVKWFVHKYRAFAPAWFHEAYSSVMTIPAPPPALSH